MDLGPECNLRDAVEEFAYYSDEPTADAGALPVWFLSKLSKTQTTVALSGEGADELFGGYLTWFEPVSADWWQQSWFAGDQPIIQGQCATRRQCFTVALDLDSCAAGRARR